MPAGEPGIASWAVPTDQMEIDCVVARGDYCANATVSCFFVVLRKNGLELLALLGHDL